MNEKEFNQKFQKTLKKVRDQTMKEFDNEEKDFIKDFDNAEDFDERMAILTAYARGSAIKYSTRITYEMLKEFLVNEK